MQAGWWTRRMTTALPSTCQASASFHQRCLSSWSTASFRGKKPQKRSTRRTGKEEKSSETLLHKILIWLVPECLFVGLFGVWSHANCRVWSALTGLMTKPASQSRDLNTNQLIDLTVSQHINTPGPYKQNELSCLLVTPPCVLRQSNRCVRVS